MPRVLDLGCGGGDSWRKIGLAVDDWKVVGIDISFPRLQMAAASFGDRQWSYVRASGMRIPLADSSIDGVLCNVALPYMNIPCVLAELRRVLVPKGWLWASIHPPRFAWNEWRQGFPHPRKTLFRSYVLVNGFVFHCSGKMMPFGNIFESCQTQRGMRLAMGRAGFQNVIFERDSRRFWCKAIAGETRT